MHASRPSSLPPSEGRDEDDDRVLKQLSDCEDAETAVKLMTDKTLENVILDDLLQKWTPAQGHQRCSIPLRVYEPHNVKSDNLSARRVMTQSLIASPYARTVDGKKGEW
jgi:hypothetical protein